MEQITVRLSTEVIEKLDRIAEESNRPRAEVVRDELNPGEDAAKVDRLRDELASTREEYEAEIENLKAEHESELEELKAQYEEEIDDLETEIERVRADRDDLKRQLRETNRRVDQHQELLEYVEEQREIERYRGRREQMLDQAGMLTRWKWKFTGVPVEDQDPEE